VVIRTCVQSEHTILNCITRRQQQHRYLRAHLANGSQNLESVPSWKHDVQDHQIKGLCSQKVKAFLTCVGLCHAVTLAFQTLSEGVRPLLFVFYDQDAHVPPLLIIPSAISCS